MTQPLENTSLPTTTPSTQFQNLPKEKVTPAHLSKRSSHTQDAHFHVHTKTHPTQCLTLEPHINQHITLPIPGINPKLIPPHYWLLLIPY